MRSYELPPKLTVLLLSSVHETALSCLGNLSLNATMLVLEQHRVGVYSVSRTLDEVLHTSDTHGLEISFHDSAGAGRALREAGVPVNDLPFTDPGSLHASDRALWVCSLLLLIALLLALLMASVLLLTARPHARLVSLGESLIFDAHHGEGRAYVITVLSATLIMHVGLMVQLTDIGVSGRSRHPYPTLSSPNARSATMSEWTADCVAPVTGVVIATAHPLQAAAPSTS